MKDWQDLTQHWGHFMRHVGIMEGEGTFTAMSKRIPVVRLKMSDKDVVEREMRIMRATCWGTEQLKRRRKDNGELGAQPKLTYWCRLTGQQAADYMRVVLPFMGERRRAKMKERIEVWENRPRKKPRLIGTHVKRRAGSTDFFVAS